MSFHTMPKQIHPRSFLVDTYFVETHEWDINTSKCTLLEYVVYEDSEPMIEKNEITNFIHDTVLQLAVF